MSSTTMSASEREQFLAQPHVAVLAVERPGRAPVAVPVWYDCEPGGEVVLWIMPGLKERLIRAAGRFALTAQVDAWPYRYVSVEGPVVGIEPAPEDFVVALCVRYMGEEDGPGFAKGWYDPTHLLVRMRPEHWLSTDYAKLED